MMLTNLMLEAATSAPVEWTTWTQDDREDEHQTHAKCSKCVQLILLDELEAHHQHLTSSPRPV